MMEQMEQSWLSPPIPSSSSLPSLSTLWSSLTKNRLLGDGNDKGQSSYLADSDGNAYEPYSMAWRYLGMYIDCDIKDDNNNQYYDGGVYRRRLQMRRDKGRNLKDGGEKNGDGDDCSRKVLWAAYHDPGYKGGSIGEYQFYDWKTDTWDDSTCQTKRCAKMDCHASRTQWQLVGVFKETDGLVDWAEQLFKHQGYCLWDGDKEDEKGGGSGDGKGNDGKSSTGDYEFMSARQEMWAQSCVKLYLQDSSGRTVYRNTEPLPGGNITDALYYDDKCSYKATMSWPEYIVTWYTHFYYNAAGGQTVAKNWMAGIERWNDLMTDYKVCQPCRAYNKVPMFEDNDGHRFLGDNQDGEGDQEQWGYNCYDDAGYLNCNQCYKFEAKTNMEPATTADLERASQQGTILSIRVNGTVYGEGGFHAFGYNQDGMTAGWIFLVTAILGIAIVILGCVNKRAMVQWMAKSKKREVLGANLKETFLESPDEVQEIFYQMQSEIDRKSKLIKKQHQNLERLQLELDHERSLRAMEFKMLYREKTVSAESTEAASLSPTTLEQDGAFADPQDSANIDTALMEQENSSSFHGVQHQPILRVDTGQGSTSDPFEVERLTSCQTMSIDQMNSVDVNDAWNAARSEDVPLEDGILCNRDGSGETVVLPSLKTHSINGNSMDPSYESEQTAQSTASHLPFISEHIIEDRVDASFEGFSLEHLDDCQQSGGGMGDVRTTVETDAASEYLQVEDTLPLPSGATVSPENTIEARSTDAEVITALSFSLGII